MCRGKNERGGPRRCQHAETLTLQNKNERRGITKALIVGAGISKEEAARTYYTIKNWSTATYGTIQAATAEAVTTLKNNLKEALMYTTLNTRDRNTIFRRAEASLGEHPTVDRVNLWTRFVDLLRRARVAGFAMGIAVTVAACGGGGSAQEPVTVPTAPEQTQSQTVEPSAPVDTPEAPVEAPVESETSFAIDAGSIEIPQDVVDAYGAEASVNIARDALAAASLANDLQELHHARTGDDLNVWNAYREHMTPEAYQRLQDNVAGAAAGDAEAHGRLASLAPYVQQSGEIGTISGTMHMAGEAGISVEMTATPEIRLVQDENYGQRVVVDMPQRVTAYTDAGQAVTYTHNKIFFMVPGADGGWLMDGYKAENTSAVAVETV